MRSVHPGEILCAEYGIHENIPGWASKLRYYSVHLTEVLEERRPIDAYLAERLGILLGTSQEFWLNLQASYDSSRR